MTIGDVTIEAGRRERFDLRVARLPTGTWASLPIQVVRGTREGPTVWLSGAIHGDEINGVDIIRRVLPHLDRRKLKGTVIAVPIVNVFGFIEGSRYLPDGRDLNRSFPGSPRGSLASRLAHLFLTEIVDHADIGLDLHTAAGHRKNHPQVRCDLEDEETRRLALAFGAPLMFSAKLRDGSLRQAALERGKRVILYEAGQVHRFDPEAVRMGVDGCLRVLQALDMMTFPNLEEAKPSVHLESSSWLRARRGGMVALNVSLGDKVVQGQDLGHISDAFGERPAKIKAPFDGFVIAHTQHPLVSQGDALIHLGAQTQTATKRKDRGPTDPSRARRGPDVDHRRPTA